MMWYIYTAIEDPILLKAKTIITAEQEQRQCDNLAAVIEATEDQHRIPKKRPGAQRTLRRESEHFDGPR